MKVAVYTIALNEAANAGRWASSAVDADYRIVADTGSDDDTVERLTQAGVTVHRIAIRPWRFDDARNAALALVPGDVDVCLTMDMDRFLAPGWRPKLEAAWTPGTTALFCRVVYQASVADPTPLRAWPAKNFHSRWDYRFRRPVHEALQFTGRTEVTASRDDIVMYEVQDHAKPTRTQYLPLMELAHREDPDDAQICFWLGRDYMWANRHERGIELLQRYLALPSSRWTEERSEAMRYLARMEPERKMLWLDKARLEAPHRRETWLDIAEELYSQADWINLLWACGNGIERTRRTGSYLDDERCWGARLFDLGAIACWSLGTTERAAEWASKAVELAPGVRRLRDNLDFFTRRRREVALRAVTVPPDAARARLFTTFATALYVDTESGLLRHGEIDGSPGNLQLLADRSCFEGSRTAWLIHGADDAWQPIGCSAEGCWSASAPAAASRPVAPMPFQLVPLERGLFGLLSSGRYLCAEPDGRITLSRAVCGLWECFLASEKWCAAPPPSSDRDPAADRTIDWPGIRSFVIGPSLQIHGRTA